MKNKKHEYLSEFFPDGLPFPFGERGYAKFDSRDTFNLDYTIVLWLYERLRYFQDKASKFVVMDDPTWRTYEVDGEQLTQLQCIDRMVDDCKVIMLGDDFEEHEKMDAAMRDLFKVFSEVYWSMWW